MAIYIACFSGFCIAFSGLLMLLGDAIFGKEWSWWELVESSVAAPPIAYFLLWLQRRSLRVSAPRNNPPAITSESAQHGEDTK